MCVSCDSTTILNQMKKKSTRRTLYRLNNRSTTTAVASSWIASSIYNSQSVDKSTRSFRSQTKIPMNERAQQKHNPYVQLNGTTFTTEHVFYFFYALPTRTSFSLTYHRWTDWYCSVYIISFQTISLFLWRARKKVTRESSYQSQTWTRKLFHLSLLCINIILLLFNGDGIHAPRLNIFIFYSFPWNWISHRVYADDFLLYANFRTFLLLCVHRFTTCVYVALRSQKNHSVIFINFRKEKKIHVQNYYY